MKIHSLNCPALSAWDIPGACDCDGLTDEDKQTIAVREVTSAQRGEIPDPYDPENRPGLWGSPWVNTSTKGTINE